VVVAVSNRIRAALTTTVLTTAATGFMAGCGGGGQDEEQVAYCTDENGEIVDEDLCDDDRGGSARVCPWARCSRGAAPGSTRATRRPGSAPGSRAPAR
jgi:hypothetical protein